MDINVWAQSFSNALNRFWTEIAGFLPNLLATIIVVFIGLFISKLLTQWVAKLIDKLGFNALCIKLGIVKMIKTLGFSTKPSELIGKLLHLFFVLIPLV